MLNFSVVFKIQDVFDRNTLPEANISPENGPSTTKKTFLLSIVLVA